MDIEDHAVISNKTVIYTKKDLLKIFPFGKTKLQELLTAGVLPVVKIGHQYITTDELIQEWLRDNAGREVYY